LAGTVVVVFTTFVTVVTPSLVVRVVVVVVTVFVPDTFLVVLAVAFLGGIEREREERVERVLAVL